MTYTSIWRGSVCAPPWSGTSSGQTVTTRDSGPHVPGPFTPLTVPSVDPRRTQNFHRPGRRGSPTDKPVDVSLPIPTPSFPRLLPGESGSARVVTTLRGVAQGSWVSGTLGSMGYPWRGTVVGVLGPSTSDGGRFRTPSLHPTFILHGRRPRRSRLRTPGTTRVR